MTRDTDKYDTLAHMAYNNPKLEQDNWTNGELNLVLVEYEHPENVDFHYLDHAGRERKMTSLEYMRRCIERSNDTNFTTELKELETTIKDAMRE